MELAIKTIMIKPGCPGTCLLLAEIRALPKTSEHGARVCVCVYVLSVPNRTGMLLAKGK